jgi:hypothetical protein
MTPLEGETAVIGLVIGNVVWPVLLGTLFLSRIWKVSTAAKPKKAGQPAPEAVTEAIPAKPSLRAS